RVRMTVDEARDRARPAPVELLDVTLEVRQIAHVPGGCDSTVLAEQEGMLHDLDLAQALPAQGRTRSSANDELREIADEQSAHAELDRRMGRSRPRRSVSASAS